ncbi:hypothetical protein D3C81_2149310 [compost metagenome]
MASRRNHSAVIAAGHGIDAQGRTIGQFDQLTTIVPDQRAPQPPPRRALIALTYLRPTDKAVSLGAGMTGGNRRRPF